MEGGKTMSLEGDPSNMAEREAHLDLSSSTLDDGVSSGISDMFALSYGAARANLNLPRSFIVNRMYVGRPVERTPLIDAPHFLVKVWSR